MKNHSRKSPGPSLLALAAVLALTTIGRAQLSAPGLPGQRAFGQRHLDVSAGLVDPRADGFHDHGATGGVGVNFPTTANIDVGFAYGRGAIAGPEGRLSERVLSGAFVVHAAGDGVKPFVGMTLGQAWTREPGRSAAASSTGFWGVGAGLEIPAGRLTLTPQVARTEAFERHALSATHVGVHASVRLSGRIAGFADATFSKFTRARGEAWTYRAGLRFKL